MDAKSRFAIQEAYKTLLNFGHLVDENSPSERNDARLYYKIPQLSSDAMRCALALEPVLAKLEKDREASLVIDALEPANDPAPTVIDRTEEIKAYVGEQIAHLQDWITLRLEPTPATSLQDQNPRKRSRAPLIILVIIIAVPIAVLAIMLLYNDSGTKPCKTVNDYGQQVMCNPIVKDADRLPYLRSTDGG
ncbi:MAG: hypothetical protein DI616_18120 [Paracoccus denitrificans]|uniref:Uncharacterized protein n=1 Tax=Paracoccus denitrificans TaxID=266 RepID=A0A533HYS9_PARDE|nr:MAG: hypothetical protein DI616_18120 [Paracoccus denitrificans]